MKRAIKTREEWRAIPSHRNYEASSLGRLRRVAQTRGARAGHIIAQQLQGAGYAYANLNENNITSRCRVHRLVAEAFHGPCPDGYEVNHKDGDLNHNRPGNLEYITHAENIQHSYDVLGRGPSAVGVEHCNAKLTDDKVRAIRRALAHGSATQRELAFHYGVDPSVICRVKARKTWKHVL